MTGRDVDLTPAVELTESLDLEEMTPDTEVSTRASNPPRRGRVRRQRPRRLLRHVPRGSQRQHVVRKHEITAFIGPSGCGKTTVLRCFNRMNDLIETRRVEGSLLYHGVDLYDRTVTPARFDAASAWSSRSPTRSPSRSTTTSSTGPSCAGDEGSHRRHRRALRSRRRPVGRGQGPAQDLGTRPLGRPAATAVHRSSDRRRARGDPHGRALLRPRPHRDRSHRRSDAGVEEPLHDHHRDPQHAAGGTGERPHGVLLDRGEPRERHAHRGCSSSTTAPTRCSRIPATSAPRTTSPADSADPERAADRTDASRVPRGARSAPPAGGADGGASRREPGADAGRAAHRRPACWPSSPSRPTTRSTP